MRFFSRLFGKNEDKQVEDIISKINLIRDDENFQNMMLSDLMKDLIEENQGCDIIPVSEGDFGFSSTNPIPVNGPIGQLAYLSKLRTLNGERIFFHRLGSVENATDVFEAVTFSGSKWFKLYLKMYYPRRSRKAPQGFTLHDGPSAFTGFTHYCENFPLDFVKTKEANSGNGLNIAYAPISLVQPYLERGSFDRPA